MPDIISNPPRRPLVGASILSADFSRLADEASSALESGADMLHLDVMDGHFVPNLTMGPALCASLRRALPHAPIDVHLMTSFPEQWLQPFADAGADHVTFHYEAMVRESQPSKALARAVELAGDARDFAMTAGLAINPPTQLERVLPIITDFDMILVMSVNPGFSGQGFIDDTLAKTWRLRELLGPDARIQMDGGVAPSNAARVRAAGCDVLAAASAIFKAADRAEAVRQLRGA